MKKQNKISEDFSLGQWDVYEYGELILQRIGRSYEGLKNDMDCIWDLGFDIKKFQKLCTMVVRLQNDKKLVEEKDEPKKR